MTSKDAETAKRPDLYSGLYQEVSEVSPQPNKIYISLTEPSEII